MTGYWDRQVQLRVSRRRALQAAGIGSASLAAASLLACSGDDDNGGGSTSTSFNTGTVSSSDSGEELKERFSGRHLKDLPGNKGEPKYGGIHRLPKNAPPSWDWTGAGAAGIGVGGYVWSHNGPLALEVHDKAKDILAHNIEPALVKTWERAGATTLVLHIDEAAKWQNVAPVNGRAFTSEDLAYVLNAYRSTPIQSFIYRDVDRIETPDAKTVRLQLKQPAAYLEQLMTVPYNMVFSKEQAESSEGLARRPVGTGAYLWESEQDRVGLKVRKNPEYWKKDTHTGKTIPYIDRIETTFFADTTSQLAAFRDKQIDATAANDRTVWEDLIRGHPEYVTQISPSPPGLQPSLALRLDKAPWTDVRLRRAMSLAIDRNAMIQSFGGLANAAYSQDWSYFGREPWNVDDLGPWQKYDPQQAKQLMSAAGFANGIGRKPILWLAQNNGTQQYDNPVIVADFLRRNINLDVELRVAQDNATWSRTFYGKQYDDMAAPWFLATGFEPDEMAYGVNHSKAPSNYTFVNDPMLDDLVIKQGNELNKTERQKILRQIMDRDLDQQFHIWTITLNLLMVRHPYLYNHLNALYGTSTSVASVNAQYVWLDA